MERHVKEKRSLIRLEYQVHKRPKIVLCLIINDRKMIYCASHFKRDGSLRKLDWSSFTNPHVVSNQHTFFCGRHSQITLITL